MKEIYAEGLAEYDGTGAPTGVLTIEGHRFTGVTGLGNISQIDGKTSTKVLVVVATFFDASDKPISTWKSGETHSVGVHDVRKHGRTTQTLTHS
jgi:hypothetical protein